MTTTLNADSLDPITIDGKPFNIVKQYKYLGVTFTADLNRDAQWHQIQKKSGTPMYLLKTMRRLGFRSGALVCVYKSLVLSRIILKAPVLCSSSQKSKGEMEGLQKQALRIIGIRDQP